MRHDALIEWIKNRPTSVDKTTMLLEHYLVLHYEPSTSTIETTRKAICDFTGWSYKTVNKALDTLNDLGFWRIESHNESRALTFYPLVNHSEDPTAEREKLTSLIWSNSSLSGTELEVALACAQIYDGEKSEASIRDISEMIGRSVNTVRESVNLLIESGEWIRGMSHYKTILRPDFSILSENRSGERSLNLRVKTGATLAYVNNSSTIVENRPYYIIDLDMMHQGNIAPFVPKRNYGAYAQRLIDSADFEMRNDQYRFTLSRIRHLYESLEQFANIETLDTLLTYQVITNRALNLKFLKHVLIRLNKNGLTKKPPLYNHENDDSGGYQTTIAVWKIMKARRTPAPRAIAK